MKKDLIIVFIVIVLVVLGFKACVSCVTRSLNNWGAPKSQEQMEQDSIKQAQKDSIERVRQRERQMEAEMQKNTVRTLYAQCPNSSHPHAIDLGLPSGTKWACCNVDASKPEDDGGYYAWGETTTKSDYSWETYKHCDGDYKSCHDLGSSICGTQYDVAHVKWGGSWQMPTEDQVKELLEKCNMGEQMTLNGVEGHCFTGLNGAIIFLPAAGNRGGKDLTSHGSNGYYWSGTQSENDNYHACGFNCSSTNADWCTRCRGRSVRPVAK